MPGISINELMTKIVSHWIFKKHLFFLLLQPTNLEPTLSTEEGRQSHKKSQILDIWQSWCRKNERNRKVFLEFIPLEDLFSPLQAPDPWLRSLPFPPSESLPYKENKSQLITRVSILSCPVPKKLGEWERKDFQLLRWKDKTCKIRLPVWKTRSFRHRAWRVGSRLLRSLTWELYGETA